MFAEGLAITISSSAAAVTLFAYFHRSLIKRPQKGIFYGLVPETFKAIHFYAAKLNYDENGRSKTRLRLHSG